MEFFENSKYKIKKPACKFCSCYQHGLAGRICNLNVDWRGIPRLINQTTYMKNFHSRLMGAWKNFEKWNSIKLLLTV